MWKLRRISGSSMLPTFRHGQVVVFGKSRGTLKPGDVVMVCINNREIVKRIVRTKDRRMYVLGDNPLHSTDSRSFGWVDAKQVSGVLRWPRALGNSQKCYYKRDDCKTTF